MAVVPPRPTKPQIGNRLLILILAIGSQVDTGFGPQCSHSNAPVVHESRAPHHSPECSHLYGSDLGIKKLLEELAEEEGLGLMGFESHHDHDGGSEPSGFGLKRDQNTDA